MVNIVSPVGNEHAQKGCAAYLASQAGVMSLTRAAAHEFSAYNIRANAIRTGLIEEDLFPSMDLDIATLRQWLESYPELKLGEHPDLVGLVLYLCSNAASTIYPPKKQKPR
jgi:NAD(P)-dependent dehydrogenase (short-subunit alcohol dehydrogenase family)